jgi:hypothetical protein
VPRGSSGLVRASVAPPFFVNLTLRDATIATQRVDGPLAELVFTLRHDAEAALRGGVHVRFVDATTGAALSDGQTNLDPPACSSSGGPPLDEHGAATLDAFAPGLYRLRFFHKDYADTGRSVSVPSGRVEELGDVPVWPKATIHGTVLDARGRPASGTVRAAPLVDLQGPGDVGGRVMQSVTGSSSKRSPGRRCASS